MHFPVHRKARALTLALVLLAALLAAPAGADEAEKLIESINDYRGAPRTCQGKRSGAVPPLAPRAALAKAASEAAPKSLQDALARVGYAAARVQSIVLSGPQTAAAVMRLLENEYCRTLISDRFAEIGVSRAGSTWRIVFAQPLLAKDLGDWREAGLEVLKHVNQARAEARTCGGKHFDAAPPLQWDAKLASAALAHSRDMASKNYFSHTAKSGSTVAQRVSRQSYSWRRVGENIAAGQGSPQHVVAGWLSSPHHCANIMQAAFREMGAAYAVDFDSRGKIYWTQVFGTPR